MNEAENSVMAEALAAAGEIPVAPPKIPEGSTLIGVKLARDPAVKNRYMVPVFPGTSWKTEGMAVAIKDGSTVAANYLYGRFAEGHLKVTSSYYVTCRSCGYRGIVNTEVTRTKDYALAAFGKRFEPTDRAMAILRGYGKCPACGAEKPFYIDERLEKAELAEFAGHVLDEFARSETVGRFLGPKAWNAVTHPGKPVAPEWQWAENALSRKGLHLVPFNAAAKGAATYIFNPGFWLGWVDNRHETSLFGVENYDPSALDALDLGNVEGL